MPWLVGMSLPDADRLITSSGLKLPRATFAAAPEWPKGSVTQQTPEPGTKITTASDIEIVAAE